MQRGALRHPRRGQGQPELCHELLLRGDPERVVTSLPPASVSPSTGPGGSLCLSPPQGPCCPVDPRLPLVPSHHQPCAQGRPQAQCQAGAQTSQDVWDSSGLKDRLAQNWKPAPGLPWGDHDLAHGFPAHKTWLGCVPPGTPGKASQMPFGCICLEGLWAETLANAHCAPVPARAWH